MKVRKILSLILAIVMMLAIFSACSNSTVDPSESPSETNQPNDELSFEEGTSSTDLIVNTVAADKVLLVVSFGTSFNQSRHLTIGQIETVIADKFSDYSVRRAFTSQIIIDKLARRDKLNIDNVTTAMNRLVLDKVKEVVIQPTTVMNGFEYEELISEVMPFVGKFESLKIGKHLLDSESDYEVVAEAIVKVTASFRADDTAIVYMGHGTSHESNSTYFTLQDTLVAKGYTDYLIGTVDSDPSVEDILEALKEMNVKKVVLRPLMVVAGDHANNDMAGDEEDSWKSILEASGYVVETVVEGLGQIEEIQNLYVKHVEDALNSENLALSKGENSSSGLTADKIRDGKYFIDVESDSGMFKVVESYIEVSGDTMLATITLGGQGYTKMYMGTAEEALDADESNYIDYVEVNELLTFALPIESLDTDVICSAFGVKSGNWFDRTLVFKSTKIASENVDGPMVEVELVGGTGRVTIESPTRLIERGDEIYALVAWSSSNYTYMLVDGIQYLPIFEEGNSVFEIPIVIGEEMEVVANTVAMSSPKEIEYTLKFALGN